MTVHELAAPPDPLAGVLVSKLAMNAATAKTVAEATGGHPSVLEAKYDGWRLLAHVRHDGVRLYSRTGKSYTGRLPHVEAELAERFPAGTWLDGEAVALRVEGAKVINDWGVAQSVLSSSSRAPLSPERITFMVFDLLAHGGLDARPLPFSDRRALLERIFEEGFTALALSATAEASEDDHARFVALGFEGSMVKRLDAPYASGRRGPAWMKLKPQTTIDAVIIGYEEGRNGFTGYVGAIVFGQHDPDTGEMVERGRCSGMDWRTRVEISENREAYLGRVVEVAHMGRMGDGLRHPQFKRFRPDRDASDVLIHDA